MGSPRQKHWSRLPFPSPGGLPNPGIKPMSPASAGGFFTTEPPGKPLKKVIDLKKYIYSVKIMITAERFIGS